MEIKNGGNRERQKKSDKGAKREKKREKIRQIGNQEAIAIVPKIQEGYCRI